MTIGGPARSCSHQRMSYPVSIFGLLVAVAVLTPQCVLCDHNHGSRLEPKYRPNTCLVGEKHKDAPSPEDDSYKTCYPWKSASCCTAEFTQQLASATVTNIDGFHWNRCGNLSPACQRFFVEIECFYRCSPNIAHWAGDFESSLNFVPICQNYCMNWFEACADDMSCATNWITDWDTFDNGTNVCRESSTCQKFRERYTDGDDLCGHLWGQSFESISNASVCLVPWFNETGTNPNEAVVNRIFGVNSRGSLNAVPTSTAILTVMVFMSVFTIFFAIR